MRILHHLAPIVPEFARYPFSDGKRSRGHLARQGPALLRWALYKAALAASRSGSPDHPYYQQVAARPGNQPGNQRAILSVARKLTRRCHHRLRALGEDAFTDLSAASTPGTMGNRCRVRPNPLMPAWPAPEGVRPPAPGAGPRGPARNRLSGHTPRAGCTPSIITSPDPQQRSAHPDKLGRPRAPSPTPARGPPPTTPRTAMP